MRAHTDDVYAALTDDLRRAVRDEELVYAAAERFPGTVPSREAVAAERELALPEKEGIEIARVFSSRSCSRRRAADRTSSGRCCGPRRRSSGSTTSARPASPISASRTSSAAAAPRLEIGTTATSTPRTATRFRPPKSPSTWRCSTPTWRSVSSRGRRHPHPRYAGTRIFGAGLNLTHLYRGRLDFLFFVTRDLGYVNKLYRGLSSDEHRPDKPEQTTRSSGWPRSERFAIGGACQILHTVDHVIATRGTRPVLPGARECCRFAFATPAR